MFAYANFFNYLTQHFSLQTILYNENLPEYIFATLIFIFFLLLRKIITQYIFRFVLKRSQQSDFIFIEKILKAYEKPLRIFFVFLGAYLAISYLSISPTQELLVSRLFRSIVVILLFWGLYKLSDTINLLSNDIKERFHIDDVLIPFLSKVLRFIIIAMVVVLISQEWDYNVNGLVAGLGLGSLAIALAAKDSLANVFGGVVIIIEKPFTIGDWIDTPSVEGTVENISFRSTRVRTFGQALVTVPNSTLANEAITNWSKMGKRRISFHLGLTHSTSREKLRKCIEKIERMLRKHPDIHPETIFVRFEKFNDSSLDIFLYFFTKTVNWGDYLSVKEDVNFKIMEILEQENASIAFPSRSIYMEHEAHDKS